jgi:arginine deiminase
VGQTNGVDSEVGRLRAVLMHRPGPELQRMTPRHRERILLRTLPWVSRARQEHDILCQALRDHGVEVLYLTELLQDALEYQAARDEAISMAVADAGLGDELRGQLRSHLEDLGSESLAQALIAGLTPDELKIGHGLVFELLDRHDFVLDPLPNLIFTKDASFWIGDQIAVTSLAAERRRRESGLASVVYQHHPRFAGTKWLYQPGLEPVDGGDVLLLAPGVIAVGVGERTTPAGTERLARHLFDAGLAHTVLAVPMSQQGSSGHLDTACAIIDIDSVIMHPAVAYTLTAHTITPQAGGMRVSRAQPFLEAAAQAMGIGRLHVIDTGTEPAAGRAQWDDGSNVLAIGPRIAVCHERNSQTNDRLEDAGIQVIRVPSSELGSVRGGPRSMSCAVSRDPAALPADQPAQPSAGGVHPPLYRETLLLAAAATTSPVPGQAPPPVPAVAGTSRSRAQGGSSQGADGSNQDAEKQELAPASLRGTRLLTAGRGTTGPEHPEEEAAREDEQPDDQAENEQVDDRRAHPENSDYGGDKQQNASHAYTVRPSVRSRHSRVRRQRVSARNGRATPSTSTGRRSQGQTDGHLAEIMADQVVCARWS